MKRPTISTVSELPSEISALLPPARVLPDARTFECPMADIPDPPSSLAPPPRPWLSRSSNQKPNIFSSPVKEAVLDISFKTEEGASNREENDPNFLFKTLARENTELKQTKQELQKTKEDLRKLAEEKAQLSRTYEDYVERLVSENKNLSSKCEKSEQELSKKLMEIENQNKSIMENLKSTTATLSENEKSYVQKINSLFSEKQALEAQVSVLQAKTQESQIQQSRYEKLKKEFNLVQSELSVEKNERQHLLRQFESVKSEASILRQEKQRIEAELADSRGLRDSQLQNLNKKLEQLIQMVSVKDQEIGKLKKELTRSNTFQSNLTLGATSKLKSDDFENVRSKNIELSQRLEELTKKYDELSRTVSVKQTPNKVESNLHNSNPAVNPFLCSEVAPLAKPSVEEPLRSLVLETSLKEMKPQESTESLKLLLQTTTTKHSGCSHHNGPQTVSLPSSPVIGHVKRQVLNCIPSLESRIEKYSQQAMSNEGRNERVARVIVNGKVIYSIDEEQKGNAQQIRTRSMSNPVKHELGLQLAQKENYAPNSRKTPYDSGYTIRNDSENQSERHVMANNSGGYAKQYAGRSVWPSKVAPSQEYYVK